MKDVGFGNIPVGFSSCDVYCHVTSDFRLEICLYIYIVGSRQCRHPFFLGARRFNGCESPTSERRTSKRDDVVADVEETTPDVSLSQFLQYPTYVLLQY